MLVYRKGHVSRDNIPYKLISKVNAAPVDDGLPYSKAEEIIYPPRNVPSNDNEQERSPKQHPNKRRLVDSQQI